MTRNEQLIAAVGVVTALAGLVLYTKIEGTAANLKTRINAVDDKATSDIAQVERKVEQVDRKVENDREQKKKEDEAKKNTEPKS